MDGSGLTRPEIAVLLSSAKLVIQQAVEHSALPNDPLLDEVLLAAFPKPMRKAYREEIETHRLRSEIIATKLANRMVNRLGMIHPFELAEEEGVDLAQVVHAAHVRVRDLLRQGQFAPKTFLGGRPSGGAKAAGPSLLARPMR